MYYISSYNEETQDYGVTDTKTGVELFYKRGNIIDVYKGIKVVGVYGIFVFRVLKEEYVEFMNILAPLILKHKLSSNIIENRYIDITDIVNDFAKSKGVVNSYPYFFSNLSISFTETGFIVEDEYGFFNNTRLYGKAGGCQDAKFNGKYLYGFDEDDILFGISFDDAPYSFWCSLITQHLVAYANIGGS